ncbi:pyridoxamine 5'-phosphate oxidase [Paenibacillus marchantiophytorum]|uniref:Pyridoxamine 5'-phosphate oxidase n=1 Tax=Paenibacillus marchantiophytorum TaxID=1619310 RepID=A0ABQ1EQB5_9BACL|nr:MULTISPECIES: pyridoxamine 5'-phosphate oxidase family protein [Paenibacillus]UKS26373.1 pyridoxamine 5'-phosphate oxidase family protein [Paenibacillus sp. HWE-109]GFZ81148.1 pyridoxamine 5'-phosphate oxidase [Paenibacillus marchantiophytorum]
MGKSFEALLPEHEQFIGKQHIFFVGSAPLAGDGHVNLSPKGHDVLRILSTNEVAYLDLTGSGNETSAHLEENGRITVMFMAFEGPPMILRLYGVGRVVLPGTQEWDTLVPRFTLLPGARQIIVVDVHEVKTSCGYSVPFYNYEGERHTLQKWAAHQGEQGLNDYWQQKNMISMDGLPTPLGQKLSTEALN